MNIHAFASNEGRCFDAMAQLKPIHRRMVFNESGLVLGAGTILADNRRDHFGRPVLRLAENEARVLALLEIAHSRAIESWILEKIGDAARFWRLGDRTLALLHLAYCGLGKLPPGEDASRRLLLAARLLDSGLPPECLTLPDTREQIMKMCLTRRRFT
jgi:hypothetical protein